jgi:hypothetical protein
MFKANVMTVDDMTTTEKRRGREQSSISFPYVDLYAAIEVARAVYHRCGTEPCDLNELADELEHGGSGTFRLRTAAARIFDLVEKRGRSEVQLTGAGVAIVESDDDSAVKADAFLRVPLYAAVYEKYHDRKLPQRHRLEDEMRKMGVPPKQVDKARQVFERSARQAGLFDVGDQRLVHPRSIRPRIGNNSRIAPEAMMDVDGRYAHLTQLEAGDAARSHQEDPLLVGLMERLPQFGSVWTDADRIAWLKLASSIFDVAYREGTGGIEIRLGRALLEAAPSESDPD